MQQDFYTNFRVFYGIIALLFRDLINFYTDILMKIRFFRLKFKQTGGSFGDKVQKKKSKSS